MIPLEIGQKVIFCNGETGRIIDYDAETEKITVRFDEPFSIFHENATFSLKSKADMSEFYLLGKNVLKNKLSDDEIVKLNGFLERVTAYRDCIRKQLFNLNERMVDDWRERQGKKDT